MLKGEENVEKPKHENNKLIVKTHITEIYCKDMKLDITEIGCEVTKLA
jgi:hypothetical protein